MEDGDSKKNLEKNFLGKRISETSDVRNVLQPDANLVLYCLSASCFGFAFLLRKYSK